MTPGERPGDPALGLVAMDLLGTVLSHAGSPSEVGASLAEEIQELTGARTVLFVQPPEGADGAAHRVVAVNPQRQQSWAESAAATRLYVLVHGVPEAQLWRAGEPTETAGCWPARVLRSR